MVHQLGARDAIVQSPVLAMRADASKIVIWYQYALFVHFRMNLTVTIIIVSIDASKEILIVWHDFIDIFLFCILTIDLISSQ